MTDAWFVASYVLLWILVLIAICMLVAVLRQIGILHARWGPRGAGHTTDGPELGTRLPAMTVPSLLGPTLALPVTDALNLIVVVNPDCSVCDDLGPGLRVLMRDPPTGVVTTALVLDPGRSSVEAFAVKHRLVPGRVGIAAGVEEQLALTNTPMAIVTDVEGTVVGKGVVNTLEQMEVLVAQSRSDRHTESTPLSERQDNGAQEAHRAALLDGR